MSNFTRIAIRKFCDLIRREDFVGILSIGESEVVISFNLSECTIDKDGRVTWNH